MMRARLRFIAAGFPLLALALVVGCNSSSTSPTLTPASAAPTVAPSTNPQPGGSATPSPKPSTSPTAGPSPTASPKPSTPPTTSPTIAPTPFPTGTGVVTSCSGVGNEPVPGVYTTIIESGNYTTGFAAVSGSWYADYITPATPPPTAPPTSAPTAGPTTTPGPSPTPVTYDLWTGSYTVSAFTAKPILAPTAAPTAVSATTGCFFVVATIGGQSPNAGGLGFPSFAGDTNTTIVNYGQVTTFSIPGLTPGTGPFSGTFTLDNNATGTVTLNSFQSVTLSEVRRLLERARSHAPSHL